MKRFVWVVLIFFAITALAYINPSHTYAFTITSDPQYIAINFSEINELNWAAPEQEWQQEIKPKIIAQLKLLKAKLPAGNQHRKLAWSTLQEYMNTPADIPNPQSYYVIKVRRIAEIAEEENLPVFLPLNGFQWWDEQPELYNWWDPDGTHTPKTFFARQRTKDFQVRFIKGYNPQNIFNVEWQSFTTPMNLNWRNWGGGGFRLAPPPNLLSPAYQTAQEGRMFAIIDALLPILDRWQSKGRSELFAGITIGTEISLNASATPKDEFMPYGYRSMQDLFCPKNNLECGASQHWTKEQLSAMRVQVVRQYLDALARKLTRLGIPKQRIYTHVWGEAPPTDPKYENYADAAFTPYARAGISLYGHAEDPSSSIPWATALKKYGNPSWGAVEYSADKTEAVWNRGLSNTLDSASPAKVVTVYNWTEHKDTPAMRSMELALTREPITPHCALPEIIPSTPDATSSASLRWKYVPPTPPTRFSPTLTLEIYKGFRVDQKFLTLTQELNVDQTDVDLTMPSGVYTWMLRLTGCSGRYVQLSEPRIIHMPIKPQPDTTPSWVKFILKYQDN